MATYYISNSGNDSNIGTDPSTPWKTLAKIATEIGNSTFVAGDFILLNRGDSWNEDFVIDSLNGNSSNPITFGAYGSGDLPEITCVADLPDWQDQQNWTQSGDLWDMDYTSPGDKIRRLWIDGVEEGQAYWYDTLFVAEDYAQRPFASATDSDQWSNTPNATFKWTGEPSATHIQVYSPSGNPALVFSSMRFYTSRADMISIKNSSYLVIENLKTTGGRYASLIVRGGHDIEIKNNDFCDRASASGVVVRTDSGIDAYNVTVHDNIINTRYTRYDPYRYSNIQFGVEFDYGAHDCEVYNNDIIGIVEAALRIYSNTDIDSTPTHDITFRDNYINGSGQRYAVAGNFHGAGSVGDPTPYNIYIYRNKFYWTTKNFQLGIKDSRIHHNVFYNNWGQASNSRVLHHFETCDCASFPDNCGASGECYGFWETVDRLSRPCNLLGEDTSVGTTTHYFNNTLFNVGNYAILQNGTYTNCFLSNNLLINTNRLLSSTIPNNWRWMVYFINDNNGHTIKNNCFAPQPPNTSYNNEYVAYGYSDNINYGYPNYIMTVPEFNAQNGLHGDTIFGNFLTTDTLTELITEADFSIPTGSSALDAGVDITSYMTHVPSFKDMNGNTVDLTSPNIGAIDNDPTVTSFTVSITQSPPNPLIKGNTVTYICSDTATSPTYQWYKNGVAVGSNSDTYTFNTTLSDDGSAIKCNVDDGTINKDSNILTLQVNDTPIIQTPGGSVYGVEAPKWIYNEGLGNEFTIFFDYVYDYSFKPKTTYIEHESELDLERHFIFKGSHWTFEFKMNLFKYDNPTAKHDEINSYKGKIGSLWMHRDGNRFKKADGSAALFVLKEIIPFYRETKNFKDALYIKFESLSPVDLDQGTT